MADLTETLRDRHRKRVVTEIAEVALALFASNGYDVTNVDEIAAAAGCSPRTFYRYFSSKDDVVFHDLPEMVARLRTRLDQHLSDGLTPWDAVTEALAELISRFDQESRALVINRMQVWLNEPSLRGRYLEYVSAAEGAINEALLDHFAIANRHDDTTRLIAVSATGAYRVAVATHFADGTSGDLAGHLRELLASLASGLTERANALTRAASVRVPALG